MLSNITTFVLTPDAYLYQANCLDILQGLPENCIDSVVCDPPYHLSSIVARFGVEDAKPALSASQRRFAKTGGADRPPGTDQFGRLSKGFMGKVWDGGDIAFRPETWAEVLRVMKPGAHLVAFGASRGYHRMACAIEDAGFEIRDSLMWIFGTGFPKSQDVSKFIDRELGIEREKVPPKNVIAWQRDSGNMRPYMLDPNHMTVSDVPVSPQAIEFDGFGTALKPAFEPIVLARKPLSEPTVAANVLRWRTGALNIDACRVGTGEERRTSTGGMGHKANPVYGTFAQTEVTMLTTNEGRWPANVVTDGSAEVIEAFPHSKSTRSVVTSKPGSIYGGGKGLPSHTGEYGFNDEGSAARFFYSAKANKTDRADSKHPTVKPVALMEWLCRLVTPKGGVILDPFAGSGTTGAAALRNGFRCVLVEREQEYVEDIQRRIAGMKKSDVAAPSQETREQQNASAA